jgi:hypothetical protein
MKRARWMWISWTKPWITVMAIGPGSAKKKRTSETERYEV